jgi:hypothetical protein
MGQVFLWILRFSPVRLIPPLLHIHSYNLSGGGTKGPLEAQFHTDIASPHRNDKDSNNRPFLLWQLSFVCAGNAEWTQIIWAVSNICLTKTKRHTGIKLTPLEENLKKMFCSTGEKWPNSNDGHKERNCWLGSKMATQSEKGLCALEFHSTKSVTTNQGSFRGQFHKNPSCAN